MPVVISEPAALPSVLGAYVSGLSARAIAQHGEFVVAVSGGSMSAVLGGGLCDRGDVDFGKWRGFFADERCVPLSHADSNFAGCDAALFSKLDALPRAHVYTIDEAALSDPEEAARRYAAELERISGGRIDLALLGMGPDGHTASLFPGHALLDATDDRLVAHIEDSPKLPPCRITLSLKALRAAGAVAFVATGASKADVLGTLVSKAADGSYAICPDRGFPATIISPDATWFWDTPLAAALAANEAAA
mmetsp:Transcript_4552/g.14429  ORF Transcript_4552/g.14429 Transcript_4552/m.14429 type:complete len:249 (-) Transcript_4552:109-855(-)